MNQENLPIIYLSILLSLLLVASVVILRQVIKTRKVETTFAKLQKKLTEQKGTAIEYYELGSIYLDKKLFSQSIKLLEKALKMADAEAVEPENKALIYNAIGYAYFAQEQYDIAIRNYKEALKLYPEYVIALNNLGSVYQKKQLTAQALEAYEEVLKYESNNKTAKSRAESLRKRVVIK
ncbi:MAG: tetratricopeptide repeat protein [Gomphosphaeria aponina SAG 52.96 = DSM 107014]|uniref:Tetratricopeptide repeat protein n=1 Tax=Gomphosphaeria aponina SAG 52.96 = DSM 107014 TaxID=1521640 RepID=A0A941GP14_9CHRO|nr:tetratricopeptide repeat protein [Gomphosphaeria aponina SAG 52.96 = DSM 107014]